jgi:NhaP-type Na+/H+ or K+/H+ antiporter
MRVDLGRLRRTWSLPVRALAIGLPITVVITAVLAHVLAGTGWPSSFLVGAVLAPTDPVFASAVIGHPAVPLRVRDLLNLESGLNDGLALPLVLALLSLAGHDPVSWGSLVSDATLGLVLGAAIAGAIGLLCRVPGLRAAGIYEPLYAIAVGLLVLATAQLLGWNEYLAAFAAGATFATLEPQAEESFHQHGEVIAELLKLAAIIVFGALVSRSGLGGLPGGAYLFVVLAIVVPRPVAILLAMLRSPLDRRNRVAAAWFGPKGFASVAYALLIVRSGAPDAATDFHLVALVVVLSVVVTSSTDTLIARRLQRRKDAEQRRGPEPQAA